MFFYAEHYLWTIVFKCIIQTKYQQLQFCGKHNSHNCKVQLVGEMEIACCKTTLFFFPTERKVHAPRLQAKDWLEQTFWL